MNANQCQPTTADAVGSAVCEVFRTMYFSEAEYTGPARKEPYAPETSIRFGGDRKGRFRVAVSPQLAARMAADFLALEPEQCTPEQIEAIVCEFSNIACGTSMCVWMPGADFHYSVPEPLRHNPEASEFAHCFTVCGEEGRLYIDIEVD